MTFMFEAMHCCYLIYLRALELFALKYINYFFSAPGLACQVAFKKIKVKSDLLTDIDMLLMVEKGIRGEICISLNLSI